MHICDIINMVTDITIYYYSKYRSDKNFIYDENVRNYMKSEILNLYYNNHNLESSNILGLTTFDSILPYSFHYIINNNDDLNLLKEKIINTIQACIDDRINIIYNDYEIISIDVCPYEYPGLAFDYVGLTHDFIVNTLDIYFYKMKQTN